MRNFLFALSLLPFFSYGTIATNSHYTIKNFRVWNDTGSNVMIFQLMNQDENANAHCPSGYWVSKSSTTGANLLHVALSAYNNQTPIRVWAYEDQDWPGLSSKECKVAMIELLPINE